MTESRPRLSRRKRTVFAAVLALGPILFLELLFRVLGLFGPNDPFSVVRDERGVELVQYNWNEIKPRFPADKIPGTMRVMVFGGSSTLGFPYQPRSSFGEMLRQMLEQSLPGLRVELINLGRVAMNSAEIVELMPAALDYDPDLVIVYSGHNEFLSLRNPAYALAWLDRHTGRFRVARALGAGIKLAFGAAMLTMQGKVEEAPLAPPPPDRVSRRDFENVIGRYRQNLELMVAECEREEVPILLNTLAGNLVGWPPELRVFPSGLPATDREQAARAVDQVRARLNRIGSGAPAPDLAADQAVRLALEKARLDAPGYAPVTYFLALLDFYRDEGGTDADPAARLAVFNRALSEEARTVIVHRAPAELNEVVRQTARAHRLPLADHEGMGVNPQWFDDHCHPNLEGQAEIARNLYEVLQASDFPRPRNEWSPYNFDLSAFRDSRQINAKFLQYVRLRLGIFLGLERDLPRRSELTRRQLEEAVRLDRSDPLPALVLASIQLRYEDSDGAAAILRPWARKQDRLRLALDRYFTRAVDLRDGVVLFHLESEPGLPPLRGLMTSGIITDRKPNPRKTDPKPRDYYNVAIDLR